MSIDITKQYQTRNGLNVVLYALHENNGNPEIHGAVETKPGVFNQCTWPGDGKCVFGGLQLVPKPIKHKKWINIYQNGICSNLYLSKKHALEGARSDCIACIEIEYEEGQGL